MASTTQDLAFDALGAAGYTGDLTERLMNWRAAEGLVSWTDYQDHIITEGAVGSNFMDAQYAFWLAGLNATFDPLDLSPHLWIDASDAATVTLDVSAVTQIDDKSGNLRHFVQATGARQPAYSLAAKNGLNVMTFDGADSLENSTLADWTALHDGTLWLAVAVWNPGTSGTRGLFGNQANNARGAAVYTSAATNIVVSVRATAAVNISATSASSIAFGAYNVTSVLADPGNATAALRSATFLNGGAGDSPNAQTGAVISTNPAALMAVGALQNGANPSTFCNGAIAELVIVTGANATETNRAALVTYMNDKWAVY